MLKNIPAWKWLTSVNYSSYYFIKVRNLFADFLFLTQPFQGKAHHASDCLLYNKKIVSSQGMSTAPPFNELYETFKDMVYNLALNYVQQKEDAEDITQEVFVKLHQGLHKYDATAASLKTWIYRITINQCLDFVKAKQTKKRFGFITSLFSKESNEPLAEAVHLNHPGIAAEDREELQKLFTIINGLTQNQKTALLLTRMDGRPQQEVAEIMSISIKAVESLLQRARQTVEKKWAAAEGK